jgi:hypothetical protein
VKLILLALAALLLAVLGSRSRRRWTEPWPGGNEWARPFPLATGNPRHPHTGVHDPYLERLR